jgi:hypothetical protein
MDMGNAFKRGWSMIANAARRCARRVAVLAQRDLGASRKPVFVSPAQILRLNFTTCWSMTALERHVDRNNIYKLQSYANC